MNAIFQLPEDVLREVEALARREGATTGDLFRRIVESYLRAAQPQADQAKDLLLPLIPASETGTIKPLTGAGVDKLLSRAHLPA